MITRKRLLALGSTVLLGVAGVVHADTTSSSDLKAEMAALRARVAELEGRQNEAWLNERRAEEVKTLVKEVLTDADTRASLLEGGMTAGHNGQNFWIGSEDGSFLLKICGQIQVRYYGDFQNNTTSTDQEAGGFEVSRAKVEFAGHISSPKFTYALRLAVDEANNNVFAEKITIGHELMDGLWIVLGEDKAPFLREELVSSANQLAVERSLVNEFFTLGYVQGLWVNWNAHEQVNLSVAISDGARSGEQGTSVTAIGGSPMTGGIKPYDVDGTDFAITARGDVLIMGTWDQLADFTAWSGQDTSVSLGAAVHYQVGDDTGTAVSGGSLFAWTVDGSMEWNGLNLFAAAVGAHADPRATGAPTANLYGVVVQGGYHVIPDKLELFARYEWIDFDKGTTGTVEDDVNLATFGANYYINKHATKFTLDVTWAFDPIISTDIASAANTAGRNKVGLRSDAAGEDDQVLIRAQMQLLF